MLLGLVSLGGGWNEKWCVERSTCEQTTQQQNPFEQHNNGM
jgi:hypothetical protein